MANIPITDHEYRYKIEGEEFSPWRLCETNVINVGNVDIQTGDMQVRVKSIASIPPSESLLSTQPFTSTLTYKRVLVLDNTTTGIELIDSQVKIIFNSSNLTFSHLNIDGSDLRAYDGIKELPIFIESFDSNSQSAVVWVKMSAPISVQKRFQIRYGNNNIASASNYDNVFDRPSNHYAVSHVFNLDEGNGNTSTELEGNLIAQLFNHTWVNDLNFSTGSAVRLSGSGSSIQIPGLFNDFGFKGSFSFSFIAETLFGRLFTKFNTPLINYDMYIGSNSCLSFQSSADQVSATPINDNIPLVIGQKYRVCVIWDMFFFYLYIDGRKVEGRAFNRRGNGGTTPATFGAFLEPGGLSNSFKGTIDSIVVYDKMLSDDEIKADANFMKTIPSSVQGKINNKDFNLLLPGLLSGMEYGCLEATIFKDDNEIKLYYTGDALNANRVFLATSPDMNTPFTRHGSPILGMGAGGAPVERQANCSYVFKNNGIYYAFAANGYGPYGGDQRGIYLYKSTDGINFTSEGRIMSEAIVFQGLGIVSPEFGNSWLIPEKINNLYYLFFDGRVDGKYKEFVATSPAIEGPFTVIGQPESLNNENVVGGSCIIYNNGIFQGFFHSDVPSQIFYATSPDGLVWTKVNYPFTGIVVDPFPITDQIADPCVAEIDGKTYMVAEVVENTDPTKNNLYVWEWDGTLSELFAGGVKYNISNEN